MMNFIKKEYLGVVSFSIRTLLWPERCALCGSFLLAGDKRGLCKKCFDSLKTISGRVCFYCGYPLPTENEYLTENRCPICRGKNFHFDIHRSASIYDGEIRKLIHSFKFEGNLKLMYPLAELLRNTYKKYYSESHCSLITFVPLSKKRKAKRGFDQSELLARRLSRIINIREKKVLKKNINLPPQSSLKDKSREKIPNDAFMAKRGILSEHRNILLIDDVITTGTTLNVCSRALKEAGAKKIYTLTIGRAQYGQWM